MTDISRSLDTSNTVRTGMRGRGHGRQESGSQIAPESRGPRGNGRGPRSHRGGRGRVRGQSRAGLQNDTQPPLEHNIESAPGRPPGSSFGTRLTEAAPQDQGEAAKSAKAMQDQEEAVAEDVEVCFICASSIEHVSIAPCNHQTCHICSLRLRALYKTRACAHCRTEAPYVVFTDNPEKRFQEFADEEFVKIDTNLGIKYEKNEILEDTILLLRYNCPDKDCDAACLGWPDLHRHVRSKHGKVMCDLCTRNKKVFTHEHELFSFGELRRHERYGDDNPGAIDQSGFKGHPECGFCKHRFYGDDELYTHCREKHERCHICDRRDGGRNPQYYLNYQELEQHFADAHFVCLDAECQANKTNVFDSEMDLKAHQLSAHPNGLSKDARRDARLVNLSGFDLRTPYQPQRNNNNTNTSNRRDRDRDSTRGNGRGRDPNAEPLPMSSAQPMSRAELAYQRQMAIQSSQSVTSRTFGGQLTQPPSTQSTNAAARSPRPDAPNPVPDLANLTVNDQANLSPQERARALRHQAVTERATNLLKNDSVKLSQFRTHISSYRSDTVSAPDLIDSFFSLFDCPSSELGKLIRELADLYEDEPKRHALLEAWNSWRSINEDYPSLPGPSGSAMPGTLGASSLGANVGSGRRVLKLKSSTAQSSRSAVSRQGSWGNNTTLSSSAAAARDPFPALAARSGTSTPRGGVQTPVWSGTTNAPAPTSRSITTVPFSNRSNPASMRPPTTMSARRNEDMFPSLPKAAKPNTLMAGFNTKGSAKWNGSGSNTPVNPWAAGKTPTPGEAASAMNAAIAAGEAMDADDDGVMGGGKKKNKGKKKGETLFHFG